MAQLIHSSVTVGERSISFAPRPPYLHEGSLRYTLNRSLVTSHGRSEHCGKEKHLLLFVNRTTILWSSSSALRRLPNRSCKLDKRDIFRLLVEREGVGIVEATIAQELPDWFLVFISSLLMPENRIRHAASYSVFCSTPIPFSGCPLGFIQLNAGMTSWNKPQFPSFKSSSCHIYSISCPVLPHLTS